LANLGKRLWDDIRPNLLWWALSWVIGSGMVTGVVAWIRVFGNSPINVSSAAAIFGSCFFVLVILFWGRWWLKNRFAAGTEFTRMMVYLPIVAALVLCIWGYFVGTTMLRLNDEVRHLKAQMVRYVLPRKLTAEQISSIGEYLSHQERNQIVFQVINRDEEAGSFRADIQQALEKGGWAVSDYKYADDVQEGLNISIQSPMPAAPSAVNPFDRLNPKPDPVQILSEAFKRAGIQIQGTGSGSGIGITSTTITISIGHRRRDAFAILPPNYLAGVRPRQPPITDDDFDNF
jgi:hypothetical protein